MCQIELSIARTRVVSSRGGWLLYVGRVNAVAIPRAAVPAERVIELERALARAAAAPRGSS
jgi:hypothetical protein